MNKGAFGFIFFAAGSAAGFITAHKLLKEKYEQLAQDEIDSVKAVFRKYETKESVDEPENQQAKADKTPSVSKTEKINYRRYGESLKYIQKQAEPQVELKPHVISPAEFGEQDGYDEISLTYYADKTLTDDRNHPMADDEIEETIGKDSLKHFGEYEPDSVFVRNDRLKADYEILMDQRTYAQVLQENPWLAR